MMSDEFHEYGEDEELLYEGAQCCRCDLDLDPRSGHVSRTTAVLFSAVSRTRSCGGRRRAKTKRHTSRRFAGTSMAANREEVTIVLRA